MKKLFLIPLLFLFSCENKPQSSTQSGDFKVEFLFENEGCRVYRFDDGGTKIYFSDCKGKTEHHYTQMVGKIMITKNAQTMTIR